MPIRHFRNNFGVASSLLELHRMFQGLQSAPNPTADLVGPVRNILQVSAQTHLRQAGNEQLVLFARSGVAILERLTVPRGLDFLLRQATVAACSALETYFWEVIRQNIVLIVRALHRGTERTLLDIPFSLGEILSLQEYEDPYVRLQQLILAKYERGTLYGADRLQEIAAMLTVREFWDGTARICERPAKTLRDQMQTLLQRRNQIIHRADQPDDGEDDDGHGCRMIEYAWVNDRIRAVETLVEAADTLFAAAIIRLQANLTAAEEQRASRRAAQLERPPG